MTSNSSTSCSSSVAIIEANRRGNRFRISSLNYISQNFAIQIGGRAPRTSKEGHESRRTGSTRELNFKNPLEFEECVAMICSH